MMPTDYDLLPPEFQRLLDEWQAGDVARLEVFNQRARSLDPLFDRRPGHNFDNPNVRNMLGVPGFFDPWYLSLAELPNEAVSKEDADFYAALPRGARS